MPIVEPNIPSLAIRLDLMINGDDIVLFLEICSIKTTEESDWKTIRLIENLFEIKLFFGKYCSFNLVLINRNKWKPYCLELLEGFFDKVTNASDIHSLSDVYARPNTNNNELWSLERKSLALRKLPPITDEFIDMFDYQKVTEEQLLGTLHNKIRDVYPSVEQNFQVYNLKNYYLKQEMNLHFSFSFYANEKIIDVVSFRKLTLVTLQNLLVKSMMIRYEKVNAQIRPKKGFKRFHFSWHTFW